MVTFLDRRLGPLAVAACLSLVGCATTPAASGSGSARTPGAIHWARTSAEHRLVYESVYADATRAVAVTAGRTQEPWGVILDADETILDNSTYQLERAREGLGFTPESWNAWVRREEATALPGARRFIERVKALGGYVAIVTNRDAEVCDATRTNLDALGIPFDVVLCREPGVSEKETRFRMVEEGTTPAGLPPLRVLAWVGDNVQDFPGGSQALRRADPAALTDFGVRFFVLPNPMYGSWERNPG